MQWVSTSSNRGSNSPRAKESTNDVCLTPLGKTTFIDLRDSSYRYPCALISASSTMTSTQVNPICMLAFHIQSARIPNVKHVIRLAHNFHATWRSRPHLAHINLNNEVQAIYWYLIAQSNTFIRHHRTHWNSIHVRNLCTSSFVIRIAQKTQIPLTSIQAPIAVSFSIFRYDTFHCFQAWENTIQDCIWRLDPKLQSTPFPSHH